MSTAPYETIASIPYYPFQRTTVPRDESMPPVEFDLHPMPRTFASFGPAPHAQTFDETDFGFKKDRPILGLNLAHK